MSMMDSLNDARDQYANINTPNLTWYNYAPEAVDPKLATANTVQDDPIVKAAQMQALAKLGDLSKTGLSDVDQQGYQQARELGNQMAASGSAAATQNANARGMGGSGMEFAQREMANQSGAGRAQGAALGQAADSARQRAMYLQAYQGGLGQMQGQQTNLNAQNAGILNQFNQQNTGAQNAAQMYNVGNQNQAQQINQQGRNSIAQQGFNNQITRAGGIAQADAGIARGAAAGDAANRDANNMMMGMAGVGAGAAASYFSGGVAKPKQQQMSASNPDDYSGYA
jgi:hypothetical protein